MDTSKRDTNSNFLAGRNGKLKRRGMSRINAFENYYIDWDNYDNAALYDGTVLVDAIDDVGDICKMILENERDKILYKWIRRGGNLYEMMGEVNTTEKRIREAMTDIMNGRNPEVQ